MYVSFMEKKQNSLTQLVIFLTIKHSVLKPFKLDIVLNDVTNVNWQFAGNCLLKTLNFCSRPVYFVTELEIKEKLPERKSVYVCVRACVLAFILGRSFARERQKKEEETSRNEIRPVFIQFSTLAQDLFLKVCKLAFQFKLNK